MHEPNCKNDEHKIRTLNDLYEHLQWALEVEHFTIPPYLCALYSIPEGKNQAAAAVILSVVMEEMLHMVQVANIMNAVGCAPKMDTEDFIPKYPRSLPHSADTWEVSLEKFSEEAIDIFMKIEQPMRGDGQVHPDHYHTIGELYTALEEGLIYLNHKLGKENLFRGDREFQITNSDYYGGGGALIVVHDLKSALDAIEEIKEQGEGHSPDANGDGSVWDGDEKFGQEPEIAHFYRFLEIKKGQYFGPKDTPKTGPTGPKMPRNWKDAYPMQPNPKVIEYPEGSEIRQKMDAFNQIYCDLLRMLEKAFTGKPESIRKSIGMMYKLKYAAIELMRIPSGNGKMTVGPSFEYVPAKVPKEITE